MPVFLFFSLSKIATKFDLPGQDPNLVFVDGLELLSKTEKSKFNG
jgi:hypothetical protein